MSGCATIQTPKTPEDGLTALQKIYTLIMTDLVERRTQGLIDDSDWATIQNVNIRVKIVYMTFEDGQATIADVYDILEQSIIDLNDILPIEEDEDEGVTWYECERNSQDCNYDWSNCQVG